MAIDPPPVGDVTLASVPAVPAVPAAAAAPAPSRSRRRLLAAGLGGLAATVAGALGRPASVHGAAGDPLIVGSETNNAGTSDTQLIANSTVIAFKLLQTGPGTALMGHSTALSGATRGVYGRTDSPNGDGVQARNAGAAGSGAAVRAFGGNNVGIEASTANGAVAAVRAIHSGGTGNAVHASANSGAAIIATSTGGVGLSASSTSSYGVRGDSQSTYGVFGATYTGTYAVYGAGGSGGGVGGQSTNGNGVYGISSNGAGVLGESVTGVGVYGYTANTESSAGYFEGTLTATTKNFRIDHPTDPAGKVLVHSCVESDERKLVYDGVVTTGANGEATVELPAWFDALNRDLRYQLTVIGSFAQAMVKREVQGNRFAIATSEPGVRVSWQVTGIRQDAWAKAHPFVAERAKAGREKGLYIHPVEHGQPEEMAISFERRKTAREAAAALR
jgi:hypothetical protein